VANEILIEKLDALKAVLGCHGQLVTEVVAGIAPAKRHRRNARTRTHDGVSDVEV
jgi:hypothetical protein